MNTKSLTIAAALATGVATPTAAQDWTEREVAAGTGPAKLHGTLTLPGGISPVPGILILAGSGPVNRDGNLPNLPNDSLKLLAHALAAGGIASLRADKRGIGASQAAGPREQDLRFSTYVEDAVIWLDVLRMEPRVSRVFLLGHSEGALVATLAAQRTEVAGLILVAGASRPAGQVIERQLAAANVPELLQDASRRIMAALEAGRTTPDVPPELTSLFRPSVQPYLASWLPLDPAAELARVRVPALVIQGTTDIQIGIDEARHLATAQPGVTLVLIEGMNHVLKEAPEERSSNLTTYAEPKLPLAPGLVASISAFLKS